MLLALKVMLYMNIHISHHFHFFTESKDFHKIRRRSLPGMVILLNFTTPTLVTVFTHLQFTPCLTTSNMTIWTVFRTVDFGSLYTAGTITSDKMFLKITIYKKTFFFSGSENVQHIL